MGKNKKVGGITLSHIKAYCVANVIKTVWYWWKNKHIDLCNRTENPEIGTHKYAQLIFIKVSKSIKWSKHSFSTKGTGAMNIHWQEK